MDFPFQVGLIFRFLTAIRWFEFAERDGELVRPNWIFDSDWDRDVSAYGCFNV